MIIARSRLDACFADSQNEARAPNPAVKRPGISGAVDSLRRSASVIFPLGAGEGRGMFGRATLGPRLEHRTLMAENITAPACFS